MNMKNIIPSIFKKGLLLKGSLVVGIITSAMLGTGSAIASVVWGNIYPGWNTTSGIQTYSPYYSFSASHQTWLSANKTTAYAYDTRYWNGSASSQYYVFGPLWITDQECNDYQSFNYFLGTQINNCNLYSSSTNLYLYNLRYDYNEYIWYQQLIYNAIYGDPDLLGAEDMLAIAWW